MLILKNFCIFIISEYQLKNIWLLLIVLLSITILIINNHYIYIDTKLFKNSGWDIVSFIAIITWFLFSTITLVISLNLQKEYIWKGIQFKNISIMKRMREKIITNVLFQTLLSTIICVSCIVLKNIDNNFNAYFYGIVIFLILFEIVFIIILLWHFWEYIKNYFLFWKEQ